MYSAYGKVEYVQLDWSSVYNADYYNIKRSTSVNGPYTTVATSGSSEYKDYNVQANQKYYYVITTVDNNTESKPSNVLSATPTDRVSPQPPSGVYASAGQTNIYISWDAVDNADGYKVKRSTISGGPYTTVSESVYNFNRSYRDYDVAYNQPYYYVITAYNEVGESSVSQEVYGVRTLTTPSLYTASGQVGYVQLDWSSNYRADYYNVKRSTSANGAYTTVATSVYSDYRDYDVEAYNKYYYVITAVDGSTESNASNVLSATPIAKADQPYLQATAGNSKVTLNWNDVAYANSYKVLRATTSGGPYSTVTDNVYAGTSFTDYNVENFNAYYYVVVAVNDAGETKSNEVSVTPIAVPTVPQNVQANIQNGKAIVIWDVVDYTSGYNVKRASTSGGPYTTIATNVTSTAYVDDTIVPNVSYVYVITAINTSGESAPSQESNPIMLVNAPTAPEGLEALGGNNNITLTWNAVSNATAYQIKRANAENGSFEYIAQVQSTSFVDSNVTNGNVYYYVVTAINSGGESADSSIAYASPKAKEQRAMLEIEMTNGDRYEYDVTLEKAQDFVNWYIARANGQGSMVYVMENTGNSGPFDDRYDYLFFNNIYSFQVNEYEQ
ncbi:fibronectin type III domain-containing protein [Longirhabdus pacifica]|uniref:fibronectin type III domain-containing protein n=1 Tax=Longirhabdus pacifica TaxID=2305227 RepID=UPI0010088F2B|nr:hypothetical protein [Longirhabdus pacifica]